MTWFPAYFDDLGFLVTLLGFAITIGQIVRLQNRQKALQIATDAAINHVNNSTNLVVLSRCIKDITEVKTLIQQGKYIEVDGRIGEIKEMLITCNEICPQEHSNSISNQIQLLTSNQRLLNKALINAGNTPAFEDFFTNLDEIRTIFGVAIAICKSK
jgi:hypothetical protein